MRIEPHSVQARLQKWGRWRQQPRPQLAAWPSIFGRIKDEGGNAGIHGDGINDCYSVQCNIANNQIVDKVSSWQPRKVINTQQKSASGREQSTSR